MQIAALGLINSLKSTETKTPDGKGAGFTSMLEGLMGSELQALSAESALPPMIELTEAELTDLLAFMETDQLLDLENGLELFSKMMISSDQSPLQIISEELGISLEELGELIKKLIASFGKNEGSDKTTVNGSELLPEINKEDTHDIPNEQIIMQLLQTLAEVKPDIMAGNIDQDFSTGLKAVKLFELLSKHQDTAGKEINLKDLLKSINDQMQELVKLKSPATNREMAYKLFTSVSEELSDHSTGSTPAGLENFKPKTEGLSAGFLQFQQLAKPEQLTIMMNQNGKPVSAEQLMKQFESILSKSQLMKNGGTQRLFIKLNPEHLGALRIELIQRDSTMIARILTTTAAAKEALDSNLNGLKHAFSAQNLQVEKVEITQSLNQQEKFFNKDQQSEQGRQQNRQSEKQQQQSENNFTDSFEQALLNTEV